MSHTFAILEISKAAYDEIRAKLMQVDYDFAIVDNRETGELLDMHGIALSKPWI